MKANEGRNGFGLESIDDYSPPQSPTQTLTSADVSIDDSVSH